jgi:hypothetical protein
MIDTLLASYRRLVHDERLTVEAAGDGAATTEITDGFADVDEGVVIGSLLHLLSMALVLI